MCIRDRVGTVGTTKPFSYEEKDGKLTGYEIEVLREIFKGSDKYEVNFKDVYKRQAVDWSEVFGRDHLPSCSCL